MIKASAVKYGFDVDDSVTLRDIADGAETSTALETPINLNLLDAAYWQENVVPYNTLVVPVHITACDSADGDETYSITLEVDDTTDLSDTPTVVATLAIPRGTTGVFYMYVDARTIEGLVSDWSGNIAYLGIRATLGGTSPSITYGAWLAKNIG
ncbi:MAG: hypothetical protein KJP02_06730 [Octadecabacter sp.]|nr:hypothetical protein [Octadecabacter sp.]